MYKVTKIMTNDGSSFDTEKEAKKYLDKKYGNQLTKIAHRIITHRERYDVLCEFLDTNLDLFKELIELKNELNDDVEPDDIGYKYSTAIPYISEGCD